MFWNINLFPKLSTEEPSNGFANYPTGASNKLNQIADCYVHSQGQFLTTYLKQCLNIFFLFHFMPSLHAKAGETVLVHGASGGVRKYYCLFSFAVSLYLFI